MVKLTPSGDWDYAYSIVALYRFNRLDRPTFLRSAKSVVQMWRIDWDGQPIGIAALSFLSAHDVFSFDLYDDREKCLGLGARGATFTAAQRVVEHFQSHYPGRPLFTFPDVRNVPCIKSAVRLGFRDAGEFRILEDTHRCLFLRPSEPQSPEPPRPPLARPQS